MTLTAGRIAAGGSSVFRMRVPALALAVVLALGALAFRIVAMSAALRSGDPTALLALPFTAILPTVLFAILALLPATQTREGLMMRVGTMIQLILIVALPTVALTLCLGFPVVFLVAELFEKRVPKCLRDPLAKLVVA